MQKKGAVSGYTDLTVYVAENQLEKLRVALEQADNINSHFDNWTALNQAAQDGYLPAAKLLVKQGADLEIRTQNYSPLISALAKRKDEMAEFLILNGADVNVRIWKNLETPLILAAKLNQVKLVKLLEQDAELWAQSYAGDTAWQWAKHKGHKEVVKHFRSANARGGFDAFDAIETGNVSGFKRAVKKTGNLYQLHPEDDALSLLSSAAKYGRVEMVSYLLDQGIDINFSALNDVTAAFTAAKNNQVTALALLIQNGADLGLQKGYAPLHTASFRGHIDVVRLLVEQGGADIMLTANNSGGTPLHMAAEGGQLEVVKYLLSQPQYRDLTHAPVDKAGATPLISLFKNKQDNRAIFALLNEQGWNDITLKDIQGKTAYDYAKKAGLNDYLPRLAR